MFAIPASGGLAAGVLDEPRRGVGAERSFRPGERSESLGRIAKSAANVDAGPYPPAAEALKDLLGHLVSERPRRRGGSISTAAAGPCPKLRTASWSVTATAPARRPVAIAR